MRELGDIDKVARPWYALRRQLGEGWRGANEGGTTPVGGLLLGFAAEAEHGGVIGTRNECSEFYETASADR